MAKQFKVGDKVMLKKSSQYYGADTSYNPRKVEGEVTRDDLTGEGNHPIHVKWANGNQNVYNSVDLKSSLKEPKENLLAEIRYTDICSDTLEVDTSMRAQVYIGAGELDSDGDFDSEKTVELNVEDVKKLRKQLKAWLDKHHPAA